VPSRETDCETAGGRRVVLSSVAAARDENNDVVGISVALIDVTRYKSSMAPSLWLPAAKSE
jgi:hypothetical protein